MFCREDLGGGHWCGQLWMGHMIKCDDCELNDLKEENLRLQNALLRRQLENAKSNVH